MEKVTIDYEKLCKEIKLAGKTKEGFALELTRHKNYSYTLKKSPVQSEYVVNLMCTLLGIAPAAIIKQPEEITSAAESAVLSNIYEKICEVAAGIQQPDIAELIRREVTKPLAEISENIEVIARKVKANTTQLERIKDTVSVSMQTEEQRAEKFLSEILSGGEAEAEEIFKTADELCIKRSELMKAKKKLEVEIFHKGYGTNKKVLWRV